jgi:hypothetical protein
VKLGLETLREIAEIALAESQARGERFVQDVISRVVAAGAEPNHIDEMACEFLRCRLVNHTWDGSIA